MNTELEEKNQKKTKYRLSLNIKEKDRSHMKRDQEI